MFFLLFFYNNITSLTLIIDIFCIFVIQVDALHMVVNPLFSSNFLPPPGFGMNPYYIVGDFSLWPYQHGN